MGTRALDEFVGAYDISTGETFGEGFEQAGDGDLEENLRVKMMFNIGYLAAKYY